MDVKVFIDYTEKYSLSSPPKQVPGCHDQRNRKNIELYIWFASVHDSVAMLSSAIIIKSSTGVRTYCSLIIPLISICFQVMPVTMVSPNIPKGNGSNGLLLLLVF